MLALYKFELLKIINRKIFWVTGCTFMIGIIIWGLLCAVLPVNREYSEMSLNGLSANTAERLASGQIAGREINQDLIDEMCTAYETYIFDGDYEKALPYLDVYNFIGSVLGTYATAEILKCDSDTFYNILNEFAGTNLQTNYSQSNPIRYMGYYAGWHQMAASMKALISMEIMFIVICLSSVFTVEHMRKTDQVILCSRFGKKKLYFAKLFAGVTVGFSFTLIISLLMFIIIALVYGLDGFNTVLQFVLLRPFNFTVGQAVLILAALSLVSTLLICVFTMVLSELTKNGIATIGIITGIMIVTLFVTEMPATVKIAYELWYLLPSNFVSLNGAFRYSIFNIGDTTLSAYQYAPILYLMITLMIFYIGKLSYTRYQISGR